MLSAENLMNLLMEPRSISEGDREKERTNHSQDYQAAADGALTADNMSHDGEFDSSLKLCKQQLFCNDLHTAVLVACLGRERFRDSAFCRIVLAATH
jgi:hypothetical protein